MPSAEEIIEALSRVTRRELVEGRSVYFPKLGLLEVTHHASEIKKDEDGRPYMAPPRDEVVFTPDP
ncbi:HU family DNA-binding protein [Salisaeta longa]|uniref:HU family DNA-binding protein n=1 Tax=Salisaeta longa TaxID=503170 RepID=UPI0003B62116|nr:HU family DNA-binding protein [Salisaeta longa]